MSTVGYDADPDPNVLEQMRRNAYDRSKWLETKTQKISQYDYSQEELTQFYTDLCDLIERVKSQLVCPVCSHLVKSTVVLDCGHFICQRCISRWFTGNRQSNCPTCKTELLGKPVPLIATDEIIREMGLFLKEAKYIQTQKSKLIGDSEKGTTKLVKCMNFVMLQRLKNIETQLMCDFCFTKVKQTTLVNCASDANTKRPFCKGCDQKYIKFYENEQGKSFDEPVSFPIFDQVAIEVYEFLNKVVAYSTQFKKPTRHLSPHGTISLKPIYKLLGATILIGFILFYFSM